MKQIIKGILMFLGMCVVVVAILGLDKRSKRDIARRRRIRASRVSKKASHNCVQAVKNY